jgi:hypothetical protein
MRSFLRSLLALLTLGVFSFGCSKQSPAPSAPAAATDVTLLVPGMH